MGGRPYPSTSEVTRTRPRREEWPCPGSRSRHASWRHRCAQRSAARQSRQRHTTELASTRQHAAHSIAEQSKAVSHNNGGGSPHHPPQAPALAQHPTPWVGARPTTRALHPRTTTAAHKQGTSTNLKGGPQGLGFGPANGWAALSKRFGGYPNSAPFAHPLLSHPPAPPPYEDFTSPYDMECPVRGWLVTALLPPPWRAPLLLAFIPISGSFFFCSHAHRCWCASPGG